MIAAGPVAERDYPSPGPRVSRPALLLAGAGSIVVMIGLAGVVGLVGLAAIILGTALAAPAARGTKGGWWDLMASGAVVSAVGAIVAIPSDNVGGLLAVIGGAAVLIAAALGFPSRARSSAWRDPAEPDAKRRIRRLRS